MLYVVAFPEMSQQDRATIDVFRDAHDLPNKDVIAPHFTLVFACSDLSLGELSAHVASVIERCAPISFVSRYAMLGSDHESDAGYVFLVPDDGFAAVSLLHDRLYSGPLERHLHLDREYIPHMTIGTLPSLEAAKEARDIWNAAGLEITGTLKTLSIVQLNDRVVRERAAFSLSSDVHEP